MKLWILLASCLTVQSLTCEPSEDNPLKKDRNDVLGTFEGIMELNLKEEAQLYLLEKNTKEDEKILNIISLLTTMKEQLNVNIRNVLQEMITPEVSVDAVIALNLHLRAYLWKTDVMKRLNAKKTSGDIYILKEYPITNAKSFQFFEQAIKLHEEMQADEKVPRIVACRTEPERAFYILAVKDFDPISYNEKSVEFGGNQRANLYIAAGFMLADVKSKKGIVKSMTSENTLINPQNLYKSQFKILDKLFTQEDRMEHIKQEYLKKVKASKAPEPQSDFPEFYAKYILFKYIEESETKRGAYVSKMNNKKKNGKTAVPSNLVENKEPISSAFMDMVNGMIKSKKTLIQTLQDMRKIINDPELRHRSPVRPKRSPVRPKL